MREDYETASHMAVLDREQAEAFQEQAREAHTMRRFYRETRLWDEACHAIVGSVKQRELWVYPERLASMLPMANAVELANCIYAKKKSACTVIWTTSENSSFCEVALSIRSVVSSVFEMTRNSCDSRRALRIWSESDHATRRSANDASLQAESSRLQ